LKSLVDILSNSYISAAISVISEKFIYSGTRWVLFYFIDPKVLKVFIFFVFLWIKRKCINGICKQTHMQEKHEIHRIQHAPPLLFGDFIFFGIGRMNTAKFSIIHWILLAPFSVFSERNTVFRRFRIHWYYFTFSDPKVFKSLFFCFFILSLKVILT